MRVTVLNPLTPSAAITASSGLMYHSERQSRFGNVAPHTVRAALSQIYQIQKRDRGFGMYSWHFVDSRGDLFVIGTAIYGKYDPTKRLPNRKVFRTTEFCGAVSVFSNSDPNNIDNLTGEHIFSFYNHAPLYNHGLRRHFRGFDMFSIYRGVYNAYFKSNFVFLQLPAIRDQVYYNLEYLNPYGEWEFFSCFLISHELRKKKTERPLELFEEETTDNTEHLFTVGIPIESFVRKESSKSYAMEFYGVDVYLQEFLRAFVVYMIPYRHIPIENAYAWYRVAILNKEVKIDPKKSYVAIEFVTIKDAASLRVYTPINNYEDFF